MDFFSHWKQGTNVLIHLFEDDASNNGFDAPNSDFWFNCGYSDRLISEDMSKEELAKARKEREVERIREYYRKRRLNEKDIEREERLQGRREYERRWLAKETESHRAHRLARCRQYQQRKRQLERQRREDAIRLQKQQAELLAVSLTQNAIQQIGIGTEGTSACVLEPEITLENAYNPGFEKFIRSLHDGTIAPHSSLPSGEGMSNSEAIDLGPSGQFHLPAIPGVMNCNRKLTPEQQKAHQHYALNLVNHAIIIAQIIFKKNQRLAELDEEDEEQEEMAMFMHILMDASTALTEREVWRLPTSSDWWDHVLPTLPEETFMRHFRLDRSTFAWLVNEIKDDLLTQDTNFRVATTVERKVAVGLKYLATTCDMLTVATLLGVGRSSVHRYFTQFIDAVFKKIVPKSIQFPTSPEQIQQMAENFETTWGFPMVIGAIHATHIPFNPPTTLTANLHNNKDWNSLMALAICDPQGKATWVSSGFPGVMSDSGAFKQTEMYEILDSQQEPQCARLINGVRVPFIILGDAGFPLKPWLLKPFISHHGLSQSQQIFNYRLMGARRTVENMFIRVKLRWRRLLLGLDVQYQRAHKVISAAFALHNHCELNGLACSPSPEEAKENMELNERFPQPISISSKEDLNGALLREKLMEYFASQPEPWSGKTS